MRTILHEDVALTAEWRELLVHLGLQRPHVERCAGFRVELGRIELCLHLGDAGLLPRQLFVSSRVGELIDLVVLILAAQHGQLHRAHLQ